MWCSLRWHLRVFSVLSSGNLLRALFLESFDQGLKRVELETAANNASIHLRIPNSVIGSRQEPCLLR